MKWVLGTGRCGMHTYTHAVDGMIESDLKLRQIAVKKYHGEPIDTDYVYDVLSRRMSGSPACITDCCQFMFIDEIFCVDKSAEFVWLIQEKKEVVSGFIKKGTPPDQRIHPKGWDFKPENNEILFGWYWEEVNRIIANKLKGKKYEVIFTQWLRPAGLEK